MTSTCNVLRELNGSFFRRTEQWISPKAIHFVAVHATVQQHHRQLKTTQLGREGQQGAPILCSKAFVAKKKTRQASGKIQFGSRPVSMHLTRPECFIRS